MKDDTYPCVCLTSRIAASAFASCRRPLQTLRFNLFSSGSDSFDCERGSGQRFFGFLGAPPSSSGMKWSSSYLEGKPVSS